MTATQPTFWECRGYSSEGGHTPWKRIKANESNTVQERLEYLRRRIKEGAPYEIRALYAVTDGGAVPCAAVGDPALLEALEIGLDAAIVRAANVHEEWRGHRPELHAEADADVEKVRAAIEALKAATP